MSQIVSDSIAQLDTLEAYFSAFGVDYDPSELPSKRVALLREFATQLESYHLEDDDEPTFSQYQRAFVKAYYRVWAGERTPLAPSRCGSCNDCNDSNESDKSNDCNESLTG
ncbi:nitrogenase-stabilizing/protective protein NifW [Vibrio sp. WXL103]|uniref:nitrogenase-stabilizing/protective protein NifW n=1 Tax=Vibrio sp. WXL103 TaxID=3450710 RepID=UPI003EC79A4E